ncbi:unnamed protein product [Paramecium pentaurelia]|uniref:Uncharacterized protein n=1 Tax=Paramecium pentaurelia TaxID=43138 RepID=A0A8S1TZR2_9CILI|nr:unnamed protein product [Paramecium pentaurelia]
MEEPRFQKSLTKEQPYFARKLFQIQMSNYFYARNELLPQQYLHETFFLVVSNAALLTWYFSKSIPKVILATCYASFTVMAYGQHVEFNKSLKYDLPQSIFTRLLYREKFNEKQFDEFNQNFVKRFQLSKS